MRTDGCLFPTYPYQWQTRLLLRLRTTCSSLVVVIVVPCWNTIRQSDNPAKSAHGAQQGSGDCARGQRCGHGGVWCVKPTPAICGAVQPVDTPLGGHAKPDKSTVQPRCGGDTSLRSTSSWDEGRFLCCSMFVMFCDFVVHPLYLLLEV